MGCRRQLSVFNAPKDGEFAAQGAFSIAEADLAAGKFTGTIAPLEAESYSWAAVYPYNEANTSLSALALNVGAAEAALVTAPSLAGANVPLIGTTADVAKDADVAVQMHHLASAIALTVKNDRAEECAVSEITLTFPSAVAGAFTVNASDMDAITYTAAEGASSKITLKAAEAVKIAAGENATFYAPIAPCTIAKDAKVLYSINGGEGELTAASDITFTAGKVKPVSVKAPAPLYILPEGTIYAGKAATFKFNKEVYKNLTDIEWEYNGAKVNGEEAEFVLDTDQSVEDAIAGKAMPKAKIKVSAKNGETTISTEFEVSLEVFWMVKEIPSWGRNCTPLFNKSCTMAYYQTRDNGNNLRELVQIDLVNKTVKSIDLKMDKASIKTDNGGQFAINPTNGDIICCNNQAIYCIAEADLSKKWQFDVPGRTANDVCSVMSGSGPAFNDDCKTIFVACSNNVFYALNAENGEKIAEYNFGAVPTHRDASVNYEGGLGKVQFAVWEANRIIMHRNKNSKCVHWIWFNDNKLQLEADDKKESNSHAGGTTDITSLAIDKANKKAYFMCDGTITTVPLEGYDDAKHLLSGSIGSGINMSPCIYDGYLYCGTAVDSKTMRINLATSEKVDVYTRGSVNNARNFDTTSADENGYIYFTDRRDGNALLLMRGKSAADGSFAASVIAACPLNGGNYQGAQNVGDGYMVACCKNAAGNPCLYVRATGAKRASGWSGFGGDVCGTNNATLAYAE